MIAEDELEVGFRLDAFALEQEVSLCDRYGVALDARCLSAMRTDHAVLVNR